MNTEIEVFAQKYISEKYDDLKLLHIDLDKIVVRQEKLGIKMAIPFCNGFDFCNIIEEIDNRPVVDKQAFEYFWDEFQCALDYREVSKLNPKLKVFNDIGYKLGDTVEVLIHYSVFLNEKGETGQFEEWATFKMWEFNINNAKVNIGCPSGLFRVIFHEYEDDDYYSNWESYTTITITGVTNDNYKDLLQQAMFWIYQMCPSSYDFHFPELGLLCWETGESEVGFGEDVEAKTIFKTEYDKRIFNESHHAEPIHFYNAAKRINDHDISFLYYYKVLEYYFIIAQRESIRDVVTEFNKNNDIDTFIDTMHKEYFGKKEDMLLKATLITLPSSFINQICDDAFSQKLINNNLIDTLVDLLYQHRNSIVHGKYEFKSLFLKVPDGLDDGDGIKWNKLIEKIAFELILKFCYVK